MLFLLLGALDLGRVFYANITVSNAAKEAALRASTGANDWWAAAVNESRGGFVTIAATNVSLSPGTNPCNDTAAFGTTVAATVTTPFQSITPFVGALLGGQTITLTSVATAHCEVLPTTAIPMPTPTPGPTPTATPVPDCSVPNFDNVRRNDASALWTSEHFTGSIVFQSGSGNYRIHFQTLAPGLAPCPSTITVGP